MLAGGLTPENVAEAIAAVRPYGVDVSSGVEEAPGVKDPDKVARFLANARARVGDQPSERGGTAMTDVASSERPMFGRRDPDARGYFGAYGGRFVPETLVAPIEELTAGYLAARADPAFRDELDRLLDALRRAARRRSTRRRGSPRPRRADAQRPHLPQARGPDAHRRAQDQQRARAGAAGPAHGQDAASSPRPAPGSTASRRPPPARCSASSASSTWAPRTCAARR